MTLGTKLGPYEIVSSLGAGGMGEVYRARDTRLDRLPDRFSDRSELRERLSVRRAPLPAWTARMSARSTRLRDY